MSQTEFADTQRAAQCGPIANVLIISSSPDLMRLALETLARKGIRGIVEADEKAAMDFLERNDCRLVLADAAALNTSGHNDGAVELLAEIRTGWPELPVVIVARDDTHGDDGRQRIIDKAVKAVRAGCCDFLLEPLTREKMEKILEKTIPNHRASCAASRDEGTGSVYRIVGRSAKLLQTVELARKVAPTSVPILISGESGTGKELISCLIHDNSRRAQAPFVRINCAALSETLLESELFGHEKGAFTGAYSQRKGRFEIAHGGTLLLDEISETPVRFQAKLLRVLEQQDFERVGGNENVKVDVRVISTTNKDLLLEIAEGRFRQDLYYRLCGVRLVVAPLKDRREDLPDLVWHFVNLYAGQVQRRITRLDPAMMEIFARYHWPGNIRQLRNVVLTSLILGAGEMLSLADVSWLFNELQPLPEIVDAADRQSAPPSPQGDLAGVPLEQLERRAILETLRQTNGNQMRAAKALGISDRTLRDKIRRYRQQGCLQPV